MSYAVIADGLPAYIRKETITTLEECAEKLPTNETVNVELLPMTDLVEREDWFGSREKRQGAVTMFREELFGVGGSTSGHEISIYVDEEVDGHREFLPNAVTHEYNHVARNESVSQETKRLVDCLALEGLAMHYEIEVTGTEPPYTHAVPVETARKIFRKINDKLTSTDPQLRAATLFGTHDEDDGFDPWGGYVLAYELIRRTHFVDELDWPELMTVDSSAFVSETEFVG